MNGPPSFWWSFSKSTQRDYKEPSKMSSCSIVEIVLWTDGAWEQISYLYGRWARNKFTIQIANRLVSFPSSEPTSANFLLGP